VPDFSPEDFMVNKRLSMRRIKEVLRLYFEQKRSLRLIAQAMSISPSTVSDYVRRAQAAGLAYPLAGSMGDDEFERLLFPPQPE
jgi:predicted DNA-binding protein YlxM (UPF0122 family)